jgi:hypothetical protein
MAKPHRDHDEHICALMAGGDGHKEVKELVAKARFICARCGRVARKRRNLCVPKSL